MVFDNMFHNYKLGIIFMGDKLNKYIVTVVHTIASDVEINAEDAENAEEKALETLTFQRENHRTVTKYCKVEHIKRKPIDKVAQDDYNNKKEEQ